MFFAHYISGSQILQEQSGWHILRSQINLEKAQE